MVNLDIYDNLKENYGIVATNFYSENPFYKSQCWNFISVYVTKMFKIVTKIPGVEWRPKMPPINGSSHLSHTVNVFVSC